MVTKLKAANLADFAAPYVRRLESVKKHMDSAFPILNLLTMQHLSPSEIKIVLETRVAKNEGILATMSHDGILTVYPQLESDFALLTAIWHESAHYFSHVIKKAIDPPQKGIEAPEGEAIAKDPSAYNNYLIQSGIEEAGAYLFGFLAAVYAIDPPAIGEISNVVLQQLRMGSRISKAVTPLGTIAGATIPFLFHEVKNPVNFVYQSMKRFFDVSELSDYNKHSEWDAEVIFRSRLGNDLALAMLAENRLNVTRTISYFLCNSYKAIYQDIRRKPESGLIGIARDAVRT